MIRKIANIIWMIFGGLISSIIWCIAGILFCITIVGAPFGVQLFKFARISFAPFGKKVSIKYMEHPILNTIWMIFFGWELLIVYFLAAIICCITIVGIPVGIQAFKFSKLAVGPFGAKIVKSR